MEAEDIWVKCNIMYNTIHLLGRTATRREQTSKAQASKPVICLFSSQGGCETMTEVEEHNAALEKVTDFVEEKELDNEETENALSSLADPAKALFAKDPRSVLRFEIWLIHRWHCDRLSQQTARCMVPGLLLDRSNQATLRSYFLLVQRMQYFDISIRYRHPYFHIYC